MKSKLLKNYCRYINETDIVNKRVAENKNFNHDATIKILQILLIFNDYLDLTYMSSVFNRTPYIIQSNVQCIFCF